MSTSWRHSTGGHEAPGAGAAVASVRGKSWPHLSSRAGLVALAAVLAAGCSSNDATASHPTPGTTRTSASIAAGQMAAHGVERPIGDVPWSQVGPGWMLAMWSPAVNEAPGVPRPAGSPAPDTVPATLYLVDPAGGRYPIATFPSASGPQLVDWSGDGSQALFFDTGGAGSSITEVDLRSGTRTTFSVKGSSVAPRYTRPDGKALLLTLDDGRQLVRVDLAGKPQLTYPTDKLPSKFNGHYLLTPDGTQLLLGTGSGLALMGNDGTLGKALPVPGATGCLPVRWWDGGAKTVLANCDVAKQPAQLWLVPIDGSAPTALTAPTTGQSSHDLGHVDAWQLPAGTYVQYLGGCGAIHLGKLNPDGTVSPVSVPNVDPSHSIYVIGVHGGNLDLKAMVAGCGPAQSLLEYDPAAGTTTVLLGPPLNGGAVIYAVPYPGQD
jgi:TolB protein